MDGWFEGHLELANKQIKDANVLNERKKVWLGAYNAAITSSDSNVSFDNSRHRANAWANAALDDFDEKFSK